MASRRVTVVYEVDETKTHYMAVDLDVWSRSPLDPLAAALQRRLFVHYVGRERRRHAAHFSLKNRPLPDDPNHNILRLVSIVKALPPAAKRLWTGALAREFNIGIQAADEPRSFELHVHPRVVAAAARMGAGVVVTVYAPDDEAEPRSKARPTKRRSR
jgi:hypothetical protein